MEITIREYCRYNESEILSLYESVGWISYTRNSDTLRRAYEHSLITLAAYNENNLLGIIRVVGDGETIIFIQDLIVRPQHQRKGIGTALLREILDRFYHVRQIQLTADNDPALINFYSSQGFQLLTDINCVSFQFNRSITGF